MKQFLERNSLIYGSKSASSTRYCVQHWEVRTLNEVNLESSSSEQWQMAGLGPQLERYEHEQVSDLTLYLIRCVISGYRRDVNETYAVLGYYAASSGNFLPTFRNNVSALSSSWPLKMRPIGFPETSLRNYHYSLCSDPEERSSLLDSFSFWSSRT